MSNEAIKLTGSGKSILRPGDLSGKGALKVIVHINISSYKMINNYWQTRKTFLCPLFEMNYNIENAPRGNSCWGSLLVNNARDIVLSSGVFKLFDGLRWKLKFLRNGRSGNNVKITILKSTIL